MTLWGIVRASIYIWVNSVFYPAAIIEMRLPAMASTFQDTGSIFIFSSKGSDVFPEIHFAN